MNAYQRLWATENEAFLCCVTPKGMERNNIIQPIQNKTNTSWAGPISLAWLSYPLPKLQATARTCNSMLRQDMLWSLAGRGVQNWCIIWRFPHFPSILFRQLWLSPLHWHTITKYHDLVHFGGRQIPCRLEIFATYKLPQDLLYMFSLPRIKCLVPIFIVISTSDTYL